MKASARASYGQYKPVIVYSNGATMVVGKSTSGTQVIPQTRWYEGPDFIIDRKRGVLFHNREDAIAYAQVGIDRMGLRSLLGYFGRLNRRARSLK